MKKRYPILTFIVITLVIMMYFTLSGGKCPAVALKDFTVVEDGGKVLLKTLVLSSAGYSKRISTKLNDDSLYVTFYSTFGFNNSIGAKSTFSVNLFDGCKKIYFYRGTNKYKLVLQKDEETDKWTRVNSK